MSLRDTIDGARKEAQEAGGLSGNVKTAASAKAPKDERGTKADKSSKDDAEKRDPMTTRSYHSSAAGAKPSREAASTVRTASSGSTPVMGGGLFGGGGTPAQKEARKEEKRKQREEEDFRQRGYDLILRTNEEYRRTDRTWWILIGVGFGMTYHAVSEINEGAPLSVHFFEEGSPWDVYGSGIIKGHGGRKAVHDVFGWLCTEGVRLDNETYVPDQVLVGVTPEIANYPKDITYADMTGITDVDEKMRLLERWSH